MIVAVDLLIPGLTTDPVHPDSGISAELNGGGFGGAHRLFNGLHQVLSVTDQHVGGFLILFGALGAQHRRLHRRKDLQLRSNRWDALAHLQQVLR